MVVVRVAVRAAEARAAEAKAVAWRSDQSGTARHAVKTKPAPNSDWHPSEMRASGLVLETARDLYILWNVVSYPPGPLRRCARLERGGAINTNSPIQAPNPVYCLTLLVLVAPPALPLALGRFVLWFCSGGSGVLVVSVVSAVSVVSVRARPCSSPLSP